MATFPTDPQPYHIEAMTVTPRWSTVIGGTDTGNEQRRAKQLFPVYDVKLIYKNIVSNKFQTLWSFFMARKGAYEAFYIYDIDLLSHEAQYCGVGDGETLIFDIPGVSTSAQKIYVNGIEQESGITLLIGGGSSNSDRVQFAVARTAGSVVSCDFTGFLRIRARFANDTMDKNLFYKSMYETGIELTGLRET